LVIFHRTWDANKIDYRIIWMRKDEEPRNYHGSKFCISYAAAKMTKQMKMQEELE
jgi:hypothetical protein